VGEGYKLRKKVKKPQCPNQGFVRGMVIESGFIMEPRGKGACLMSYVVQADINIWVPSMIIYQVLKMQVVEVVDRIRLYFHNKRQYENSMRRRSRNGTDLAD